ncbi:hypothetical protein FIU97_02735 [Roseivivax sp. THAF40]|uniref:periplasmic heavy metal sensor n=1 Tax=unclassified Roseivivax TaxID=2639302 RepID=UPI0012685A55|nr:MULTISPECIES: periplasmic heavy metal sensor [unclassified Roseivivax]QFS81690.1 hypothetical protein FIV09_02515 [Roseivivax sp. THAF197b]QFT45482.1 hypothetical protein FIU97_02735 [Roseivivax sp. THAF40]
MAKTPSNGSETLADRPRTPRFVKIILFLSLALNLVVAGLFVGLWADKGPPRRDGAPTGIAFMRALEPEDRRGLALDLRGMREADRAAQRREIARGLEILRSDPFEPEAFVSVLDAMAERGQTLRRMGQDALLARVAEMSPAERAAYADRLEARLASPKRR